MKDNTVVLMFIIFRSLATISVIGGATFLAYHGKDGWGWLIFLAVILGAFSIKTNGD